MEVRSVQDLDFDREQLKVVQGKMKRPLRSLSKHLIRGLKTYIAAETKTYLFNGQPGIAGGDFDSRYSQRGVQWAVKQASKAAGITKEVCVHSAHYAFTRRRTRYYHLKISWDMKI
jgi:integrase